MTEPEAPPEDDTPAEDPASEPDPPENVDRVNGEDTTLYACPQCEHPGQYGPSYSFAVCPNCGWPAGAPS